MNVLISGASIAGPMRMLPYMPGSSWMMKLAMRNIGVAARDIALPAVAV